MCKVLYISLITGLAFLCGCQGGGLTRSYVISEDNNKPDQEYLSDEEVEKLRAMPAR